MCYVFVIPESHDVTVICDVILTPSSKIKDKVKEKVNIQEK